MTAGPEGRRMVAQLCCWAVVVLLATHAGGVDITTVQVLGPSSEVGECADVTLACQATPCNATLWWSLRGVNLTGSFTSPCPAEEVENGVSSFSAVQEGLVGDGPDWQGVESTLLLNCTHVTQAGNYTCHAADPDGEDVQERAVELWVKVPLEVIQRNSSHGKVGSKAHLSCTFRGHPLSQLEWRRLGHPLQLKKDKYKVTVTNLSEVESILMLKVENLNRKDNGSYQCLAKNARDKTMALVDLIVLDKPQVSIEFAKAVGARQIFLNWTVETGNSPVQQYFIQRMKNGSNMWLHNQEPIPGDRTSFILKKLDPSSTYNIRLQAKNEVGTGEVYTFPHTISTLEKDPVVVPDLAVKGYTPESITVGWTSPPAELREYVHYYQLAVRYNVTQREAVQHAYGLNLYLFADLRPAAMYFFKVAACSEWTKSCGNWSKEVNGTTMDGVSGPPHNVTVSCKFDNISRTSFVYTSWDLPLQPNGVITHYNVILQGWADFMGAAGYLEQISWGPKIKNVDGQERNARFDVVPPNTNYTVQVCAVTRSRKCGHVSQSRCSMPPTVPEKDQLSHFNWTKTEQHGKWVFRLFVPRVSERNGPICCYRVVLVRMQAWQSVTELPSPEDLQLSTYEEVHNRPDGWGAYVAEMFESDHLNNQVILGDGYSLNVESPQCQLCLHHLPVFPSPHPNHPHHYFPPQPSEIPSEPTTPQSVLQPTAGSESPEVSPMIVEDAEVVTQPQPSLVEQRKRRELVTGGRDDAAFGVQDGDLKTDRNYTGFVEIIVLNQEGSPLKAHSAYFSPMIPGPSLVLTEDNALLVAITATVLCGLLLLVLLLLVVFCVLRQSKRVAGDVDRTEMSIRSSIRPAVFYRTLCRTLRGRHVLVPSTPPDMAPIAKDDLVGAYVERHRDSDYGFQQEFEMLPDRFPDRTTRASEAREHISKNRYPDIKAYDQTRVKLSTHSSNSISSDYVNANFVVGYKERKKFICAQGPMETTQVDFWRMVWEQRVELILMLTNLEEYNKSKCSKYWPDEGSNTCGDLTISYVSEKRFSDYVVRNLKLSKPPQSAFQSATGNGPMSTSPSNVDIEKDGNGPVSGEACSDLVVDGDAHASIVNAAETNGGITIVSAGGGDSVRSSAPSSPAGPRERPLVQYHYLVWKDFMAPEHPAGILRFVKRVGEVCSQGNQGPVLVHCSAGVGRTGTLVALDSLLQQLAEEGEVAVFNTVCELRHQRNYLVQSLKQYIFIYRSLMEMSQFGDTEIEITKLKVTLERLRARSNGKEKVPLEEEFQRLSQVLEDRKSFSVGAGPENAPKNRGGGVILPYDRNRVILTPIPAREHSTYINASFVEGYDNSESFIIAQDPLECTLGDFWRMLAEQGISTLVMLSDLGEGEGKCPRYWPEPDAEATYEHIRVRYLQSESCPYYTWREFAVSNTKTDDGVVVTQFQYHGWPMGDGEVPEVTRGLVDLVDTTQKHQEKQPTSGPIAVHCSSGTDRSAIFVALAILAQMIRTEGRLDVFTIARKLRSQRQGLLRNFAQYEFLYRAVVTYVELHNLLEDDL